MRNGDDTFKVCNYSVAIDVIYCVVEVQSASSEYQRFLPSTLIIKWVYVRFQDQSTNDIENYDTLLLCRSTYIYIWNLDAN